MKLKFRDLEVYDNYITNCDAIVDLLENKYKTYFIDRQFKEQFFSVEDNTGGGDVLIVTKAYEDLFKTIFQTISKEITPNYPDEITIYRYYPGAFLKKHKDFKINDFMINDLIFLQSSQNHLKFYTKESPNGFFIEELPGRRIILSDELEHEITQINDDEKTRYTMTMAWMSSKPNISWWSKR